MILRIYVSPAKQLERVSNPSEKTNDSANLRFARETIGEIFKSYRFNINVGADIIRPPYPFSMKINRVHLS